MIAYQLKTQAVLSNHISQINNKPQPLSSIFNGVPLNRVSLIKLLKAQTFWFLLQLKHLGLELLMMWVQEVAILLKHILPADQH